MKKSMKRITALLLALTLALVFIPAGGPAKAYADIGTIDASMNGESGVIMWNNYEGTSFYSVYIGDQKIRSFSSGSNSFNVFSLINEALVDGDIVWSDDYLVTLEAYDGNDDLIADWKINVGQPGSLGDIGALSYEDGNVSWSSYPGTDHYSVRVYYWEEVVPGSETEFPLVKTMAMYGMESGYYTLIVKAFNSNNEIIAYARNTAYKYEAPEMEYGNLNVKIDSNGKMTWDPVEGVSGYYVCIDNWYWDAIPGTAYELNKKLDEFIKNGYIENRGTHTIWLETDSPFKYYTWEGSHKHFLNNKETDTIFRYFGSTRYETSLKVADAYMKKLNYDKLGAVILAYGKNYADALAGSYLSACVRAPILLVDSDQSHIDAVQAYIKKKLDPEGTIYLLGGEAVVPDAAVAGLSGYTVKRLGGTDRYATNIKILREGIDVVPWDESHIIVASGIGFADSLSAASTGEPIMLVKGKTLNDEQIKLLKDLKKIINEYDIDLEITVIGGTGAVSQDIFNQLKAYGYVTRVGGNDRYETSQLFAEYYFGTASAAVVAYGANFPDGLCGGSLANVLGAPLLLAANGKTTAAAAYAKKYDIIYGAVLGGPALISDASAKAIFAVNPATNVVVVK